MNSGYVELANAILEQAVYDYRKARRRKALLEVEVEIVKRTKLYYGIYDSKPAHNLNAVEKQLREIESFFNSNWGNLLCHAKAGYILERLKAEPVNIDDNETLQAFAKKHKASYHFIWQCVRKGGHTKEKALELYHERQEAKRQARERKKLLSKKNKLQKIPKTS